MDLNLAKLYGTPGADAAIQEDLQKTADIEMFTKLASDADIDLSKLNNEQVSQLWNDTFAVKGTEKVAGEHCPKCHKADCVCPAAGDKTAAAQAEFDQAAEWKQKVAEMDHLGRLMAHAYVNELGQIEAAMQKAAMEHENGGSSHEKKDEKSEHKDEKSEHKSEHKDENGGEKKKELPPFMQKKEGSATDNIDALAAVKAIEKAAAAEFDKDDAERRVAAVVTLGGPGASEKIASAQDLEGAVDIRALEFLEAAGYTITWEDAS